MSCPFCVLETDIIADPLVLSVKIYLRKIPPKREALRHSGGERRLFTSAMVTLYLEVELSSDKRPGTEQNRSVGFTTHVLPENKSIDHEI